MKCTKCQGEWTPPANQSLGKCPFCQADILQMLNEQAEVLSTEVILANMLQAYGTELLQNQQRLTAMISDLFAHDHKTKRLLLLSVRENIPMQLIAITDSTERNTQTLAIQNRLVDDAFLKEEVAEQIVNTWTCALGWNNEESDDSFEIVWENGYWGFMNPKGDMITEYEYKNITGFNEGLARVGLNDKFGFINKQGKVVIPIKYDTAFGFSEGLAMIELNGKYGFINKHGTEIIPFKYDDADSFSEGLARVKLNGKFGFIDKQGSVIISFKYEWADEFIDGLVGVELNKKFGFVDKKGKEIISIEYDNIWPFIGGLAMVELNGKHSFIDKKGNWVKDK